MQLQLVAVGKLRPAFRSACDEYLRRLERFIPVAEAAKCARQPKPEVSHDNAPMKGSGGSSKAIPRDTAVVLLDIGGASWTSEALAERLDAWRHSGRDRAFVIGGAVGVAPDVKRRAELVWSLGPLTLPHELARVVVVEQLYRASTILRGEPYHKGVR